MVVGTWPEAQKEERMSEIKVIETVYNGYRFRSRLEARWAVFFDALNIHYDYEPEGFDLGEDGWYLPDFWLPQVKMWAEVKAGIFSSDEKDKCKALAKGTGWACLMLDGPPACRNYWAYEPEYDIEGMPELRDYIIFEGHRYWETEGRFFGTTWAVDWEIIFLEECDGEEAVAAARQARFEHGERP